MNGNSSLPAAAIFDMDGVLVDSNPFHLRKWAEFLTEQRIAFDPESLSAQIIGQRNDTAFRFFFGAKLSEKEMARLSEQLEEKFRSVFRPYAKPPRGLKALIREFERARIPMAVASSGMAKNIEFVLDALKLRPYFRWLVSGDEVSCPKPEPEIYLKTAERMGFHPGLCVAFEDSFVGLESARRAGMKCVAIASTFPLRELETHADLAVESFAELNLKRLRQLFISDAGKH